MVYTRFSTGSSPVLTTNNKIMGKKVGDKVVFRNGGTYDYGANKLDDPNGRGSRVDTIVKVMSHGVKTKNNGYVNNKRILNYG